MPTWDLSPEPPSRFSHEGVVSAQIEGIESHSIGVQGGSTWTPETLGFWALPFSAKQCDTDPAPRSRKVTVGTFT